ncbi:MAG: bifunctional hydroxymethylpyrimidine kinase/phosphomethylpyrimidine kinase [bacterium]|nr:bifunctional hydroxymethylpyrimidine kinase/phosphomethylpyrimidine kinase [bacterium]
MKKVLEIAGSDSSGGAGMQADIKTITVHNMYAMSVITAVTAQNTLGVSDIMDVIPDMIKKQMTSIFEDIRPDAVKIGMVLNVETIKAISDQLMKYKAENIVVDPVMVATSGSKLLKEDAKKVLMERLFPLATVITPNIPEAEELSGISIQNKEDMVRAAERIATVCSCAILIKGGHLVNEATDLLYQRGKPIWFPSKRITNPNTHGTGCTLSSAIACELAAGKSLEDSIKEAKDYLMGALRAQLDLGRGSGPLNHMYASTKE